MMICILLLACAAFIAYRLLKWHFCVFERLKIPGPEPSYISGNLMTLRKQGQLQAVQAWGKQYGRVFGYYEGWTPVIVVAEPEILKSILVKDFENFRSRKPFPLAPRKSLGLFLENGDQWKKSRTLLTPAFSSGKLRHMFSAITDSADNLVSNTDEKCDDGKPYDVYSLYQSLTLDIIGKCAFGLRTNAQTDANDPFLKTIRSLFDTLSKTCIQHVVMLLPFLSHFVFALKNMVCLFGMNPVMWVKQQMGEVVKIRRDLGRENDAKDLVHLMLFPEKKVGKETIQPMTEREIVAQSMTFLLAGYETTSAVLAFLTHVLATHADVQEKLCEEVDTVVKGKEVTYELVNKLPYFDMVIDEVCRMYPTASLIVTRKAKYSRTYNDLTIPAGMCVQGNIWGLHRDEEFWDDVDQFIPERFSPENKANMKPFTFLPFGAGPRMCIGQRFAILEIKVAIAKILQSYMFSKCKESEESITLVSRGAIVPKHGVNLRVHRRHSI